MLFFIGWHQPVNGPSGCGKFPRAMVSVNRLLKRKTKFPVNDWILDSGAFTRLINGKGHLPVESYAEEIVRWHDNGNLVAAVAQDYLCDPVILEMTGLSVQEHQRLTIEKYDELLSALQDIKNRQALEALYSEVYDDFEHEPTTLKIPYIMPVLQGYTPDEYVDHIDQYGDRLKPGAWVGVGSICGRSGSPGQIECCLLAIHARRPDLKLHGFGIKKVALSSSIVWDILYSADSLAASASARRDGRNQNDPLVAIEYAAKISRPNQLSIFH
jgi:hypothetical protein